jgi:hypothetical protein
MNRIKNRFTAVLTICTLALLVAYPFAAARAIQTGLEPRDVLYLVVGLCGLLTAIWNVGVLVVGEVPYPKR